MSVTPDGIQRLAAALGGPRLQRVRERLVEHLASGGDPDGTATLADASHEERQAVAALLGTKPSRASRLPLPLAQLSLRLRQAGLADDIRAALEALDGPIPDRPGAREAAASAWTGVATAAGELDQRLPELGGWAVKVATSGRLRRASGSDPVQALVLLAQLESVLTRLPLLAGIRQARLANEALGSAHALDRGTVLGELGVEAVRAMVGHPALGGAEGVRESWAAVGVLADDLTSRVCVLNLPAVGDGPADDLLRSAPGEPTWLTLRLLVRHAPTFADGTVFACENLSVIAAAADVLGENCAPLICVAGNPVVAVMRLLDIVAAGASSVAYHGDFDWPGLGIAARVLRRLGDAGVAWRMMAGDYLGAVQRRGEELDALRGRPTASPWDAALAEAMRNHGVAVEEEAVMTALLGDLGRGA